jgi:gliding motility-associated-like protein
MLGIELEDTLEAGVTYYWCLFVSPGERYDFVANNLGIALTTTPYNQLQLYNLTSEIYGVNTSIILDTMNWVKIEGSFVAQGGERYLYIGNFHHDSVTQAIRVSTSGFSLLEAAYYFVDNIYLGEEACSPLENVELSIPNVFTPNNDGINDQFKINIPYNTLSIVIYNRWGEMVFESDHHLRFWDGTLPNGNQANEGVYYYVLTGANYRKTGFIHLLR